MKANDEVPASQGKIPMAFTARAAVAGEPSCHAGAKMAKIAPRAGESGECRLKRSNHSNTRRLRSARLAARDRRRRKRSLPRHRRQAATGLPVVEVTRSLGPQRRSSLAYFAHNS